MSQNHPESLHRLNAQLACWYEALEALRCTVNEDRPAANDVALADCYDDAVCDALSSLEQVRAEVRGLAQSVNAVAAARGLHRVHTRMNELCRQHSASLIGWERMTALAEVGARRGRSWSQWATALRRTLEGLPDTIFSSQQALAECWQEFAEQLPRGDAPTIQVNEN